MRVPSPGSRRRSLRPRACLIGLPAARSGACPRWLLWCVVLLLGLCRTLGVQAAELPRPSGADPRPATPPGDPAAPASTAAAVLLASLGPLGPLAVPPPAPSAVSVDQASLCRTAAADPAAAGSPAPGNLAAGQAAAAGAFRGFADDLPGAAEPPPLVTALGISAAPSASSLPGAAQLAAPAQLGQAAAAPPPPQVLNQPPRPHPALGFDGSARVPRKPFGKIIYQVARSYALNPLLVAAIAKVESDFNPRARSRKGACGLMQVLPATARRFGLQRRRDLFNPRKNIETASRYLRWLVDRFGDDPIRVLAAYNAGEGAVDRFGGVPPFAETRGYVTRIFALLGFTALLDAPVVAAAPAAAATVPVTAAAALAAGGK
jgi:soluble lytic murein transglycosylase-like protein